ncbi:hypothetical protein G3A39_40360 [Paraburkholderia aspalathi]|nr:hypothetical protein [Paraburkholderia aspalathi]
MSNEEGFSQKFENYRPSKGIWFWSVAGAAVLTMVVGFTAGGWTTGGTSAKLVENATREARAELVANLCVQNFANGPDASAKLTELKDTSSYQRSSFITKGGWDKIVGMEKDAPGAAKLCAEQLAAMDASALLPATPDVAATEG